MSHKTIEVYARPTRSGYGLDVDSPLIGAADVDHRTSRHSFEEVGRGPSQWAAGAAS